MIFTFYLSALLQFKAADNALKMLNPSCTGFYFPGFLIKIFAKKFSEKVFFVLKYFLYVRVYINMFFPFYFNISLFFCSSRFLQGS